LRDRWPSMTLMVLTVHDENDRIMGALCNGADGYLLKNTPPARLLEAIREAALGGSPMSPEIARQVVMLFRKVKPPAESTHQLTPHEFRILQLLVEGENYKSSAVRLGVSPNTVAYHVRKVYSKLHVHSRSEAVSKALRSGLLR
jgi:DNA-binding NarL/FixJ family response regulator